MTEPGFTKADCDNLPAINDVMVARYFSASDLFNSSEIKGVKTHSAGQKNYANSAVGYVQLKREGASCILKGKVCPEHKVRAKQYNVYVIVDEAARCKTAESSLVESLTGRLQIRETEAMKRGINLEKKVLEALEAKVNIKFTSTGLLLSTENPNIGASPDAISDEMVVEIKCPSTLKAVNTYVKDGVISNKFKSQIQLQMHLFEKKKGIFCVTDPAFEINGEINVYYVQYDKEYIEQIINAAEMFWKNNVFPILIKSIK